MFITIEDYDTGATYLIRIADGKCETISRNYADGANCLVFGTRSPSHEAQEYTARFEREESRATYGELLPENEQPV